MPVKGLTPTLILSRVPSACSVSFYSLPSPSLLLFSYFFNIKHIHISSFEKVRDVAVGDCDNGEMHGAD